MIKTAYKFDEANKAVKELYKKTKDAFDKQIKSIKSEKEIDNDSLVIVQTASQISTSVYGVALSEYYSLIRRNVSIAARLAAAANSKAGKKAKADNAKSSANNNEEVEDDDYVYGESATYSREIASLFDWKF